MIRKIARYKIREEAVEEVRQAIIEFVDAIAANEPHTNYEANQTADGVSFVHLMAFPDTEAEQRHRDALHTGRFTAVLYPNCVEMPVFTDLTLLRATDRPPAGR